MHPKERAEPDDNGGEGVSWRKAAFRSKRQPATRTCPSACRGAEALDGLQVRRYEEHHGHLAGHAAHVCDVAGQQVAAEDDVPGGVIFISTERMGVRLRETMVMRLHQPRLGLESKPVRKGTTARMRVRAPRKPIWRTQRSLKGGFQVEDETCPDASDQA